MSEHTRTLPAASWSSLVRVPGVFGTIAFILYLGWNIRWIAAGSIPPSILLGVFGIPAPTTGMTRSTFALLEGHWSAAFLWNPFTIPCYLLLTWTAVEILTKLLRRRRLLLSPPLAMAWPCMLLAAWATKFVLGPQWW